MTAAGWFFIPAWTLAMFAPLLVAIITYNVAAPDEPMRKIAPEFVTTWLAIQFIGVAVWMIVGAVKVLLK